MRPHLAQPRQCVFQLSQLHLQPGFARPRPRGEDVENQLAAVEYLHFGRFFKIADLGGRQVVVENNHVGIGHLDLFLELRELAFADVGGGIDFLAPLRQTADDDGPGRRRQAAQLFERIGPKPRSLRQRHAHEQGSFQPNGKIIPGSIERHCGCRDLLSLINSRLFGKGGRRRKSTRFSMGTTHWQARSTAGIIAIGGERCLVGRRLFSSAHHSPGRKSLPLVVQKFGGSSVATAERIMAAARRALRAQQAGNQVIVVVSARGDTTDELIALAREISEYPPAREMDMLLSTGEQISIALMAMAIQSLGQPAISFTGAQIGIVTDSFHTKARIKNISTQRMRQALHEGKVVIVAGFQGIDENYNITTLGRGGSDTTAVALAAVMKHDPAGTGEASCEIYTDVDGVYTTDPRIVPEARKIDVISYDEMLELASVGAGVMHSRSIEFAKKFETPL